MQPSWVPSPEVIRGSNVHWLMQQVGAATCEDLHRWSVTHRDAYWKAAIERLGILFDRPCRQVLDQTEGVEHARWLVGAEWNMVESCLRGPPDSVAITFASESAGMQQWSVEQLRRHIEQIAAALSGWGVGCGDAVALLMPMTPTAVAAYLAILRLGAVAVGIAESFAAEEIELRLRLSRAKRILVQAAFQRGGRRHDLYRRLACGEAPPAAVIASGEKLREGDLRWDSFLKLGRKTASPVPLPPDAPIGVLFSSGTTGDPKAIPWTNLCPIKCAADAHFHQDIHPGDVVAWPTSLGWMMGPWLIFAALVNRAAIALFDGSPVSGQFLRFVQQAGVTMLGVVPSLVATWKERGECRDVDFSTVKVFSSTGECSNARDMQWLMERAGGRPVIEYCGGTEIAGGYITGTVVQPCVPATFSTPTLGIDCLIVDERGQPADQGELFLVPPSIGMSTTLLGGDHHEVYYANCPRGPQGEVLRRHGDQMQRLPNGYWRAQGRVDDTMNLGGVKVSSAEIERVLRDEPGLTEVAAVAIPPADGGPCELVVFAATDQPLRAEPLRENLQQAIRRRLNPLFKIARVVLIDALPRTASNKIMRRLLRQQLEETC